MTSSIDFEEVKGKMQELCQLHAESTIPANQGAWGDQERYNALRVEVAELLEPLFTDLNFCEMFILFGVVEGCGSVESLKYEGVNGGIEFSKKN
jgi:hypothetical protein